MSVASGVLDYLRAYEGLEDLELDRLGHADGAACLQPMAEETVRKRYLDGSSQRQAVFTLWVRRAFGGGEQARLESLALLDNLADSLETATLRGDLPELGDGLRAWSLRATASPATELLQEDGLLVDGLTLQLIYFMEGYYAVK